MKQIAAVELERCVALADLLETVPAKDFNMRGWVTQLPMQPQTMLYGLIKTNPGCGFAGCAMGWAAVEGIFPDFYARTSGCLIYEVDDQRFQNWDAVRAVMGLTPNMSHYLFAPNHYKTKATPAMVADRVRRFANKIAAIRARDRRRVVVEQPKLELVYQARVPRRSRAERPQLELAS